MKRICVIAACLVALAVVQGCKEKDDFVLLVDHAVHVVENEMECADCHASNKAGGFVRPGHRVCNECHDDIIETKKIEKKTCGVCHREKNLAEIPERPAPPDKSRSFVHGAGLGLKCDDCHTSVKTEKTAWVPPMSRRQIIRIRDRYHAAKRPCEECHLDMDPKVAPANHKRAWVRLHGLRATADPALCSTCHHEETCRECHQSTMPSSHNALWRMKTHGIRASFDRRKCQVCHEEDFCVACHAETRPRSHVGGWDRAHCYGCHTSESAGTGCSTCHEASLEAHPNPHKAGWRQRHCNQCHPGTVEYRQCLLCHPGGVRAHPNIHKAGWQNQHCINCHPGNPGSRQCSICHPGGLPAHPDPHRAGWRKSHCVSCHAGGANRDECAVCHPGGNSIFVHDDVWVPAHGQFVSESTNCLLCH